MTCDHHVLLQQVLSGQTITIHQIQHLEGFPYIPPTSGLVCFDFLLRFCQLINRASIRLGTVDGSEIRRSPVEVGSLSHYLLGFIHPRWSRISSINSRTQLPPSSLTPQNRVRLPFEGMCHCAAHRRHASGCCLVQRV